jgi:hypothetical protein
MPAGIFCVDEFFSFTGWGSKIATVKAHNKGANFCISFEFA